jgi:hypothetical protein
VTRLRDTVVSVISRGWDIIYKVTEIWLQKMRLQDVMALLSLLQIPPGGWLESSSRMQVVCPLSGWITN